MSRPTADPSWRRPVAVTLVTTAAVAVLSYTLPVDYAATGVGLAFLTATYLLTLRRDEDGAAARHYGLSLGGLLDPEPISVGRLLRDAGRALGWALAASTVIFPFFWLGFVLWWGPAQPFLPSPPPSLSDDVLGQILVIALPEEAFYRGYLQTALDDSWSPRWRVLGARIGPALIVSSALFAFGHLVTEIHPNRLAVFFPSLVFGWLRARTGGIGAALSFHAACNLFASFLGRSYGLHD